MMQRSQDKQDIQIDLVDKNHNQIESYSHNLQENQQTEFKNDSLNRITELQDINVNNQSQVDKQTLNIYSKVQENNCEEDEEDEESINSDEKINTEEPMNYLNLQNWHRLTQDELKQKLKTDFQNGLRNKRVNYLLKKLGDNSIDEYEQNSYKQQFLIEIKNRIYICYWLASIGYFILYAIKIEDLSNLCSAILVILMIIVSSIFVVSQKRKNISFIKEIKKQENSQCYGIRQGKFLQINVDKLVEGDIVFIQQGFQIPADIRLIQSSNMKVDTSMLTGEGQPVIKEAEDQGERYYIEANNMVLFGSYCTEGRGKGVVVKTGKRTVIGQLCSLLNYSSNSEQNIPFIQDLRKIVKIALIFGIFYCIFLIVGFIRSGILVFHCIQFCLSMLLLASPISLRINQYFLKNTVQTNLLKKQVEVKKFDIFQDVGRLSHIFVEKSYILTQNIYVPQYLFYNSNVFKVGTPNIDSFDINIKDKHYLTLIDAALITCPDYFQTASEDHLNNIDYQTCVGNSSDEGLIRFLHQLKDLNKVKLKKYITKNNNGCSLSLLENPYNLRLEIILVVEEEEDNDNEEEENEEQEILQDQDERQKGFKLQDRQNSHFSMYIKGPAEDVWQYCSTVVENNKISKIDEIQNSNFRTFVQQFKQECKKVTGFAKLKLSGEQYPRGSSINIKRYYELPFDLKNFQFCGAIVMEDLPVKDVGKTIERLREEEGIKVILVSDEDLTGASYISKQANIIPQNAITNIDLQNKGVEQLQSIEQCEALIVSGLTVTNYINKSVQENNGDTYFYIKRMLEKKYIVFSRTNREQIGQIIDICQQKTNTVALISNSTKCYNPKIQISVSSTLSRNCYAQNGRQIIHHSLGLEPIIPLLKETTNILLKISTYYFYIIRSSLNVILPILFSIITEIPFPLSGSLIIAIIFSTHLLPSLSVSFDSSETDHQKRKHISQFSNRIPNKVQVLGLIQIAFISTSAAFLGYFTTLNYFGFPIQSLFGLITFSGYKSPINDFKSYSIPFSDLPNPYFNQNLFNVAPDCTQNKEDSDKLKFKLGWFDQEHSNYDLRKIFLKCDESTKQWIPALDWSYCDTSQIQNQSRITNQTVCYSTESLKWAQSSYFVCILFIQTVKILFCTATKMQSFDSQRINKTQMKYLILIAIFTVFILYIPGIQNLFGTRPLHIWLFGVPSFSIIIFYIQIEEVRKYVVRNLKWFFKFANW